MSCSDAARTVSRPKRCDELEHAVDPEPRGRDLRLEVADDELGQARVVGQDPPGASGRAARSSSTLTALSSRPSAHASVASTIPHVPGVSAPRSRWCAVVAEKPTSSSPTKIGMTIATSG